MTERNQPVIGYVLKMYPRFSETFIVSEILAREAGGEKVVIFSMRPCTDTRFHPELARVQAPVIQVPRPVSASGLWQMLTPEAGPHLAELLRHRPDDAGQAAQVAVLAKKLGVTHLHAHFATMAATVARLAGLIAGLPYSFTAHAKDIFHESVVEEDLREKFADAHHAVTISRYNLAHLRARFPESAGRMTLVYNGLELERFPFSPERGDDLSLLAVGRLVEKKGFAQLIEAVRRLRERGLAVTAEIAGDGPLREELQEQIDRAGLGEAVTLLGPLTQSEVRDLLGTRRLFVAPFVVGADGNADGLPTVLLEAMACGIPCVAADVTAVGEVIITGRTGRLVPAGGVGKLTDAIDEALRSDCTQLVHNARRLVEETFDSRRQAKTLRELQTPAGRHFERGFRREGGQLEA
ncbi:glycosyltransferase family 4 protein [Corynebacterium comes]|uniref:Teichuronic acid biosynthesis glycosyltransferase TuaC n=1 Tax=Corynebacterium comes TaxID=2675218 RepID=A0A6B8VIA9_9CORY|nr:glycosyltransferase family 4 protein [Corynebacterium comes]QGU05062.1 Putative teichuronic acid biosynthesis glycosyltransferase TuaC [Corynebacterium comes]